MRVKFKSHSLFIFSATLLLHNTARDTEISQANPLFTKHYLIFTPPQKYSKHSFSCTSLKHKQKTDQGRDTTQRHRLFVSFPSSPRPFLLSIHRNFTTSIAFMIICLPFHLYNHNPSKIWSPTHYPIPQNLISLASFVFLLILAHSVFAACSLPNTNRQFRSKDQNFNETQMKDQSFSENRAAMKVHPMPKKRNNITIQFYSNVGENNRRDPSAVGSHKKLRRLPHIFSRVLELPFRSDADVSVEESSDCFRFVAETDNIGEVRAYTIEIHPGVTKIVIRPNGYLEFLSLNDLELDMWRFRLPDSTRPELASAVFVDGELIVTVPKREEGNEGTGNDGEFRGGMGNNSNNNNARLVLVQ